MGGRESGPGFQLIRLARGLNPGDTVRVEYRRGNADRRATETMMPLASALAAIGGVLLMFWRKVVAFIRMAVGGVTRTFSRIFASSR
jgi:hypothetical protein